MTITQLNINSKIIDALTKCGYENLTEVQSAVLQPALDGQDLFVRSQTGSGKTMAFGIPLVNNLSSDKGIEVLVVCPTRELAQQVASEVRKLTRKLGDEMVNTIYGGAPIHKQIATLKSGRTKIVVGTPGRILDHIKRGTLNLATVKSVVLDEADEMLNMGFLEDIQSILDHVPENHQTLLFSATYPANIVKLANKYLKNATKIEIGVDNASLDSIRQEHVHVDRRAKSAALIRILNDRTPTLAIVFCNTKIMTETLAKLLRDNGFRASALNGDMRQNIRTKMMRNIKEGKSNILVATDVAARGIDIKDVSYIINYDIPNSTEFYLHRIGRTARAGKQGNSVAITTTKQQQRQITTIAQETHSTIYKYHMDNLVPVANDDTIDSSSLLVSDVKNVDSKGNAIKVSKPKSTCAQPKSNGKQSILPKGKDNTKRAKSNKFTSAEYMSLMAEGLDSNTAMNTAKAGKSKYAVDYNHPVDKQEENWQADYNYNSEKSTAKKDNVRGKSRGSANGKAPRGRATYSSNKDTKYNTNRGAGDNATKSNRRGNKAVHATANSDTQHTISHKVNKAKSNKYLAECVQSVNSSAETSSNRAKAKSNSARRAKDKTRGEVLDNSTNMDMPPVKRKTTSNKKSKQYNHYS